jgi:asparagine synthetase B (glutamine-hydrolysing)
MLSPLEIAAGFPLPERSRPERLARSSRSRLEPRTALEQSARRALRRPPCIVSFSGGRDSSLVLAIAVDVARREGLPLPVPVTVRVFGDSHDEEHQWQEVVVRHLRLDDWVRLEIGDELDCIGPVAQPILLRHGLLWPANVHFHVPQLERARGGSLLTGIGGDEMFSSSGWARLRRVLAGRALPQPRDTLRLAAALAPHGARRRIVVARNEVDLEWLKPAARNAVLRGLAEQTAAEPVRWGRRFAWLLGLRYLELCTRSFDILGRDWDVAISHPLLEPELAAALSSLPRSRRFDGRTEALTTLFGDLLPPGLASRRSKAAFTRTLWGRTSSTFAFDWDGSGVDPEIVDVDVLLHRWRTERAEGPHMLLQSLWLERERARQVPSSTLSNRSSASGMAAHDLGRRSSHAGSAPS